MLENVRGPITEHVFMYACGKMLGGFADIAGITAGTYKLIYHTRTEPTRDRIFHTFNIPWLIFFFILMTLDRVL